MRAESEVVEGAIVVSDLAPVVQTRRAIILADALKEATEQRALLVRYVRTHMRENVDFGTIPGTPKPSLWKAGAEKLTELYRCTPKFSIVEKTVDWERGFFHYTFRCRLESRDSGSVLAEGFGSCSSRESKYRWRDAKMKCPACGAETLFKSKDKPEWFCWSKKGGCGATFNIKDKAVVDQPRGKVENPDAADVVNTVLKMAKKRAHVDGAIALAGCSDLFTQDLEDMPDLAPEPPPAPAAQPAAPAPQQKTSRAAQVQAAMKPAIVDVKQGETEEQAKERQATPIPDSGYAAMADEALTTALEEAKQRVADSRTGTNLYKALQTRVSDLEAELERRISKEAGVGT